MEAALTVLEAEGAAALTIRRIAADVEYTAPIVYQYFASKDALIVELIAHGYELMLAEAKRIAGEERDVDRRFLGVARGYMRFAAEHPHLFAVMNNGIVIAADERQRVTKPTVDLLLELITTWADAHGVVLADPVEAGEIVWGALYGIASLGQLGVIGAERAERLGEQALATILRGWLAGPS
ncbi:hypothetical protein Asp14428_60480 [Actinoplanes sp. NBRC 14428]|nr:hypothetical protein Asp14428_60480 [Actinoplanes sp. NBRC 14428]